jgi:hypothetical protein
MKPNKPLEFARPARRTATRPGDCSRAPLCTMTDMMRPNAKVLFRVPNEDGTVEVETLWATRLGGDKYRLDNSPFYAYGVSWKDVVLAPLSEEEQLPTFQSIVAKSGNRTVRVIFDPPIEDGNESDEILKGLASLGCDYEGANRKYVSVNIPPNASLDEVREYLIEKEATWEHADPTYDSLFPEHAQHAGPADVRP